MAATQTQRATLSQHMAAAATAVVAAVLMTWPLARDAGNQVLAAKYGWDAYTNAMIMGGHVDALLGRGPLSFYDNYFFAPLPHSIVFNENLFGLSLIFAPFYLVSANPLWAYNLTLLVSLALSVFFTYLLVRRLTDSAAAGVLAGVAFAFCPYVMFELGRIQLVATQWIPACFLLLHCAIEERRLRDVVGLWACYLLQIGTCLYYAMFLIPLLALVGAVLIVRKRPTRQLTLQLAALGALAAGVALAMVYPYFAARETFFLERSLEFASSYDGQLGFFSHVGETNLSLTALHHRGPPRGAHEEIAFPGFTLLGLLLLSLGVPLWRAAGELNPRVLGSLAFHWVAITSLTLIASLLAHSLLAGAVVFALGVWWQLRIERPLPFAGPRGLYLALVLLSVVMFLGLAPMHWDGAPVRGLYYYFHTYFPGFNGIRKVSRQALMTTFALALLSSFGSAWLFSKLPRRWMQAVALCSLLAATCYELRCFPHPMKQVWAGATVPKAYGFLAAQPSEELVAAIPQNAGVGPFRGDHGLAFHNYLMLYHKHRSLNGQSSWMPPVTELVRQALRHLPDDGARRILQSVGASYILVHGGLLEPERRDLPGLLSAEPESYRNVFEDGADVVFALSAPEDPTLALADVAALPEGARRIPRQQLRAHASVRPQYSRKAIDDNPRTFWSSGRPQERGEYFEISLAEAQSMVAFEIENHAHVEELPLSFTLSVALGESSWQPMVEQPEIRVYRDQIYAPKRFVFRIVLPQPTPADRLRITLDQPVPGQNFTIHDARLYAEGP